MTPSGSFALSCSAALSAVKPSLRPITWTPCRTYARRRYPYYIRNFEKKSKSQDPNVDDLLKEQTKKTEEATGKMIVEATHDAKAGPAEDIASIQKQLSSLRVGKTKSLVPPRPSFYKPIEDPGPLHFKSREIRISPQRMNLVLQQIKGLTLEEAKTQLKFSKKLAAKIILEYLSSRKQMLVNYQRYMHNVNWAPPVDQQVLYISQGWINQLALIKEIDMKGRGRFGQIRSPIIQFNLHFKIKSKHDNSKEEKQRMKALPTKNMLMLKHLDLPIRHPRFP